MPRLVRFALLAGLTSPIFWGFAQHPAPTTPTLKRVPIQPTSSVSGQQMYATYCAVCHGKDGTGNGPAASAMRISPTDLTVLSRKNGGVFPGDHINSVLKFGVNTPAHGTADMPIWGDLMLTLNKTSPNSAMEVHQRITNLTDYLKQIQK